MILQAVVSQLSSCTTLITTFIFFVKQLTNSRGRVQVIPTTEEKYISLIKGHAGLNYRFVDGFRFLQASLTVVIDKLEVEDFIHTTKHFPDNQLPLLRRKQFFPYDYISDWRKYDETQLPDIEKFYNELNNESLSHEDYIHAIKVWKAPGVKNLGEYSDFYIKI